MRKAISAILWSIAVFALAASLWADSLNMELVGREPSGSAYDIYVGWL